MTDEKTDKPRVSRRTSSTGAKPETAPKPVRPSRAKAPKAGELPPQLAVGGVTQSGALPEQYDAQSAVEHADPMPKPESLLQGATQAGPLPEQVKAKKKAKKAEPVDPDVRHAMIAQRAYFIAQTRGFTGDYSMDDWLQAEAEIDANFFGRTDAS